MPFGSLSMVINASTSEGICLESSSIKNDFDILTAQIIH